jgi:hypothetical protein
VTMERTAAAMAVMAMMAGGGVAQAGPARQDQPRAIREVLDCRTVPPEERLACFEKAADALAAATDAGEVVAIDRGQATAARRAAFGLPLDGLSFLDRAVKPEAADKLGGVVKSVKFLASGFFRVELEDGSIWRQISGDPDQQVTVGSPVVVERAALGSFAMRVKGRPPVKVHRDI